MHKPDLVVQIYPTRHYEQLTDIKIMQRVRGDTVRRNITRAHGDNVVLLLWTDSA